MLQAQIGQNVEVYFINEVLEGKLITAKSSTFVIQLSGGGYPNPFTEAEIPYEGVAYIRVLI